MVLSIEQAGFYEKVAIADDIHLSLVNDAPLFYDLIPFVQVNNRQWKRRYRLEDDLKDNSTFTHLYESDGGTPPIPVSGMTVYPWGEKHRTREAQWQLTKIINPYVTEVDEDLASNYENQELANLYNNLEMIGRKVLVNIIRRGTTPPNDELGSLSANLNGWSNTTPAFTQGYSANVLAQQTVTVNSTLWNFDQTSTGIVADPIQLLNKAIAKTKPRATAIIVPQRFIDAMIQSYYRRGVNIPEIIFEIQRFSADPVREPIPSYKGVPFIVVPDVHYASAGHDIVTPDYDIYVISGSTPGDPFKGVSVCFNGEPFADDPAELGGVPTDTFNLGLGIKLEKTGRIQTTSGVVDALGRVISTRFQLCVGQPQACTILQGVQD